MPEGSAGEWLVEEGIGEQRALLIHKGEAIAARLFWPGELTAGQHLAARLTQRQSGARRGVATLENGMQVLVDHLPKDATEGTAGVVRIVRSAIAERGRLKQAHGRWSADAEPDDQPRDFLPDARRVRSFDTGQWEEVWHAASSGSIAFSGGEILCSATPAMTLIDVDGVGSPRDLALASIPAIAKAVRWFDIGGSIGIDFPTVQAKIDRKAVDTALDEALDDWPHERTAINGFGFVQLVARLEAPSLLHRFSTSRTALCARAAIRAGERVEGAGATLLTVHPALKAKIKAEWVEELVRRTGRQVRIETDPGLALEAPHAQIVGL